MVNTNNTKSNDDDELSSVIEWELNKRRGRSATFTQPLLLTPSTTTTTTTIESVKQLSELSIEEEENIRSFLSEFYSYQIFDLCKDMKQILHIYKDTVGIHYKTLVPTLCSFDEFWSRYYYRCSYIQVKKDLLQKQRQSHDTSSTPNTNDISDTMNGLMIQEEYKSTVTDISECNTDNASVTSSFSSTTTTTNTGLHLVGQQQQIRNQMFSQEFERDIIEVIPETNENDHNEDEDDDDEEDKLEHITLKDS